MDFRELYEANLYKRPLWEELVPEGVRSQFSEPQRALSHLESHPEDDDATIGLFWRLHTLPKGSDIDQSVPNGLEILLADPQYDFGPLTETDVEVTFPKLVFYTHILGSLATLMSRKEAGFSERFIELIERITCIWQAVRIWLKKLDKRLSPKYLGNRSFLGIAGIAYIQAFRIAVKRGQYEHALLSMNSGLELMEEAQLMLYRNVKGEGQSSDVGFPIAEEDMEQEIVDAFEALYDTPSTVSSWSTVAECCNDINWNYDRAGGDRDCYVTWKGEKHQWVLFWPLAYGLCRSRLSQTDYEKLVESNSRREAERRLENYFFLDSWGSLPGLVRAELVMADRLWMSQEDVNYSAIIEHLRLATEYLLRPVTWDRFDEWEQRLMSGKDGQVGEVCRVRHDLEQLGHTPSIRDYRRLQKSPSFRRFLVSIGLQRESWLIGEVFLNDLEELANTAVPRRHPDEHTTVGRRSQVAPFYSRFVGIGCWGYLPRLSRVVNYLDKGSKGRPPTLA